MTKKVMICYASLNRNMDSEHTSLFYLSAALEKAGYQAGVFHGAWNEVKDMANMWRPDAVGFSCDAENQHLLYSLIPAIRRLLEHGKRVPIVVGGPQAIGLDEMFMKSSDCDYVLRGEGDETLPALMDCVLKGNGRLEDIPGLIWREDGLFHENKGIGLVRDLSALPRPAYHTALDGCHYGHTVFSGRGCPFECAFCVSGSNERSCRLRDIDDVLAEVRNNLEQNPNLSYIIVQDDTFCVDANRVRAFCKGMREIRCARPVVWYCETHIQTLLKTPNLLKEMIGSGLVRLQVGMESGDENVLKLYRKHTTPDEIFKLVSMAVKLGLPQIAGNFIVGGPREKPGVTEVFIRGLLRAGPAVVDLSTSFLRNYPGSAIAKNPDQFGLRVVCEDGMTAGDDYPSVIPSGGTVEETIALRQTLNKAIRGEMAALIDAHALPLDAVLQQFRLYYEMGLNSRWMQELQLRDKVHDYYKTIYVGEGEPYSPDMDSENTYPQRTFDFYRNVFVLDGIPRFGKEILSPLEYRILFYSAGKLSISEMAKALWPEFRRGYADEAELTFAIKAFLVKADQRYWVTAFSHKTL